MSSTSNSYHEDYNPPITQRTSRNLLFKIKKDKQPFLLDGCQAIFIMKLTQDAPDEEVVLVKKTVGYPSGGGGDDQIDFFDACPPNGGDPVKWGLRVRLKPTDITIDMVPGEYYIQIDIIPVDNTDRFIPVKGFITIEPTGNQTL